MKTELVNKIIKLLEYHIDSAGNAADYWENSNDPDARRFRSAALSEYTAYSIALRYIKDEKFVDASMEIWER